MPLPVEEIKLYGYILENIVFISVKGRWILFSGMKGRTKGVRKMTWGMA